jgi:hypothetical protein
VNTVGALVLVAALSGATACSTRTAGQVPARPPASVPAHAAAIAGPAVTGVVRDTNGRPVAGASVRVEVEQSSAEHFADAMKALSSLGIACGLAGGCTQPSGSGYSAQDGSFAIAVPKANPGHDAYSVTVVAAHGALARVGTSLNLPRSTRRGINVGPVVLAAGNPRVVARNGLRQVVPPALPASYRAADFSAEINTETGTPPVIDGAEMPLHDGYDPLAVEDEHLLLTTAQTGAEHGRAALFSSSLDVHATVVPVSRHAPCYVEGSRGQRIKQPVCGLTDGVLDKSWAPNDDPRCSDGPCPGGRQNDHRDVTVVLPKTIRAQLVAVRGCIGCTVAISADGQHFTTIVNPDPTALGELFVARLHGGAVRAVRVQTDTGGFFDSLREVSVFSTAQRG